MKKPPTCPTIWDNTPITLHSKTNKLINLKTQNGMETNKKYFMDCHLAGRMYHDADTVWNQLTVGTKLRLLREADNRHDPDAVQVVYYDKETEENVLLGYIPSTDNEQLAIFMDMGWGHLFECRICQVNPEAHPERQIHLSIKVRRNKDN